jgi:hypothetical protein
MTTRRSRLTRLLEVHSPISELETGQSLAGLEDPDRYLFIQLRQGMYWFSVWMFLESLADFASEGAEEGWMPDRVIDLDTGDDLAFNIKLELDFTPCERA